MKITRIFVYLSLCVILIETSRYNYNDPLGIEPEKLLPNLADIGDDVIAMPNFTEIASKKVKVTNFLKMKKEFKELSRNSNNPYPGEKGYIDPVTLFKTLNKNTYHNFNRKGNFRFTEPEDEYYNPNQGSTDPNAPPMDLESLNKKGLSNGCVLFKNRRTLNFETGQHPNFTKELKK